MNIEFALAYIPARMRELGFGDKYIMRFRHIKLKPRFPKRVKANKHIYFLIETDRILEMYDDRILFDSGEPNLMIRSGTGSFQVGTERITEQHYEHTGRIEMYNYNVETIYLKFIQVIPLNK